VTGATGFIGGRLTERLMQSEVRHVRALMHKPSHAARISRLPVDLYPGDLLDRQSVRRALEQATMVIHLGLGHGPSIIRGTKILLEEAEGAKITRFVHLSTSAVHGLKPPRGCDGEDQPLRRTGNIYCDCKAAAEEAVHKSSKRGLPIVVLRPSIVWGPFSRWCTRQIDGLRRGAIGLIDGGQGICNTVYVDNLIDAIFLALENDQAVGEAFFISDAESVTWEHFIRAHAALMDPAPQLANISSEEVESYHRSLPNRWTASAKALARILVGSDFRNGLKQVPVFADFLQWLWYRWQALDDGTQERIRAFLGAEASLSRGQNSGLPIPDLDTLAIQTCETRFSIEKARRVLGYEPRVSFAEGMQLTQQWLRFANYL